MEQLSEIALSNSIIDENNNNKKLINLLLEATELDKS